MYLKKSRGPWNKSSAHTGFMPRKPLDVFRYCATSPRRGHLNFPRLARRRHTSCFAGSWQLQLFRVTPCKFFLTFTQKSSRIMKAISKEVVFIISPFLIRLYRRSSYLRYNQYKHCGFVSIKLQHDCLGVTQTTVTCLNW